MLQVLSLHDNNLKRLPNDLCSLTKLTDLNICNNRLRELPKDIGKLVRLVNLDVQGNFLYELPPSIVDLTRIECVLLSRNSLCALPDGFGGNAPSLRALALANNSLQHLPVSLKRATRLQVGLHFNHRGYAD